MNQDIGRAIVFFNTCGKRCGRPHHDFARHNSFFQYNQSENTLQHNNCILFDNVVLEWTGYAFCRPRRFL